MAKKKRKKGNKTASVQAPPAKAKRASRATAKASRTSAQTKTYIGLRQTMAKERKKKLRTNVTKVPGNAARKVRGAGSTSGKGAKGSGGGK